MGQQWTAAEDIWEEAFNYNSKKEESNLLALLNGVESAEIFPNYTHI